MKEAWWVYRGTRDGSWSRSASGSSNPGSKSVPAICSSRLTTRASRSRWATTSCCELNTAHAHYHCRNPVHCESSGGARSAGRPNPVDSGHSSFFTSGLLDTLQAPFPFWGRSRSFACWSFLRGNESLRLSWALPSFWVNIVVLKEEPCIEIPPGQENQQSNLKWANLQML
jgi:hypothetical protein